MSIKKESFNASRRQFMEMAGKGILLSPLLAVLPLGEAAAQSAAAPSGATAPSGAAVPDRSIIDVQLPPLFDSTEPKDPPLPAVLRKDSRVGFCIVGLGHLALGQILPAFAKSKYCRPVALVSGDPEKAGKVAAQYGIAPKNIYSYPNFDSIRDNKEIEVVYIVLPNSLHAEYTIRAANAGKDVLCEKPMAISSREAQQMIAACNKAGGKLMIAYRIQYEPHHKMAMKWTRSQELGKIKLLEAFNGQNQGTPDQYRLKKAMAGGGSLPDIGLYCTNTMRYYLGEEPSWVFGTTYSTPDDPRFKEVEETVIFQLGFPSGVIGYGGCSYGVHKSAHIRCYTDKGATFGLDPSFKYSGLQLQLSQARTDSEDKQQILLDDKDQFATEMDHMAMCVIHDQKPFTPGEEGLQDHKIMEAIYESARTGKPVQLEKISGTDVFRGTKPAET